MEGMSCVFCAIVAGREPATVLAAWPGVIAIRPLEPVTDGHTLVIPQAHVVDVAEAPAISALTMVAAAELAGRHEACNVITSRGSAASQTQFHLHIHVVPRRAGDGLALPWGHVDRLGLLDPQVPMSPSADGRPCTFMLAA